MAWQPFVKCYTAQKDATTKVTEIAHTLFREYSELENQISERLSSNFCHSPLNPESSFLARQKKIRQGYPHVKTIICISSRIFHERYIAKFQFAGTLVGVRS